MPIRKTELELLNYVTDGRTGALAQELARWSEEQPRFVSFIGANRDKIRKKLRTAKDDEASASVWAELATAHLLLADPRLELALEAFGSGSRGPDLTITFRSSYRFNVEITQPRQRPAGALGTTGRLPAILLGKLRQLPAGMANVLVIAIPASSTSVADVAVAARLLKSRVDPADTSNGAHGFTSARSFSAHYRRLSAACVLDIARGTAAFWPNPEAKHPLPPNAARALRRCLGAD